MNSIIEKYLEGLFNEMVLDSKSEKIIGRHGSHQGDEIEFKQYYDIHRNIWTTYEKAVEGYILNRLSPTINKIIK